ncbi:hypothetical protein ACTG23_18410 [Aeromonas enteropelogenes]|uniref:hypothetical protein n=1 Tax=Aeromonas enteropelogenes TaxID=29489 RepID=UPI003F797361
MKYINQVRKFAAPVARKFAAPVAVAGLSLASASAFAVDITTEFNAAKTQAMANMDLVILGVVALALLTFGVAAVLSWARK